ncbi:hypothetical protein GF325_13785 [Candidatus Bathyarchaeota archaeon]|nr:hypothetical protein [Candidatus Bathyarchaeota archaeon]
MFTRKLDFILDDDGFISMIIYNSHPDGRVFIAPKYFPSKHGNWKSRTTGQVYDRFEYYWDLKNSKNRHDERKKLYSIDDNPLHDYESDVLKIFKGRLETDPCHGVLMYSLDATKITRYCNAKQAYKEIMIERPGRVEKFNRILDCIADTFDPGEVGITGSYLYDLYQDFSDINFVLYDGNVMKRFHDFLLDHECLVDKHEVTIQIPSKNWNGWLEREDLKAMKELMEPRAVDYHGRFIGSLHDEKIEDTRAGFWTANTVDVYPYGTFKKEQLGKCLLKAKIREWQEGMASGNFPLENVEILGIDPAIDKMNITEEKITSLQIIGQFHRMFLFDEYIYVFGLLQEVKTFSGKEGEMLLEILVGGREMGGWILPLAILTDS